MGSWDAIDQEAASLKVRRVDFLTAGVTELDNHDQAHDQRYEADQVHQGPPRLS